MYAVAFIVLGAAVAATWHCILPFMQEPLNEAAGLSLSHRPENREAQSNF